MRKEGGSACGLLLEYACSLHSEVSVPNLRAPSKQKSLRRPDLCAQCESRHALGRWSRQGVQYWDIQIGSSRPSKDARTADNPSGVQDSKRLNWLTSESIR